MMRFILVETVPFQDFGIPQWRATCATEDKTVDVFFYATDIDAAREHVRKRFSDVSFSDQAL